MKIIEIIKKLFIWETYENGVVSVLKFFIRRNPVSPFFALWKSFFDKNKKKSFKEKFGYFEKYFSTHHPFLSAFGSLFFMILIFTGISYFAFNRNIEEAEANWWDETWGYRQAISITNSSGADLTDFQVSVTLDTASLITDGKMQSDCDDLRFTDINGSRLPFWIEENNPGCNSATTKIWLKIPTVYDGTDATTVYSYYGNSNAENKENGDEVFEFFDDFSSDTSSQYEWETVDTSLPTNSHSWNGNEEWLEIITGDNDRENLKKNIELPVRGRMKFRMIKKDDYPSDNSQYLYIKQDDNNYYKFTIQGSVYSEQGVAKVVSNLVTDISSETGTVDNDDESYVIELNWTKENLRLKINDEVRKDLDTTNTDELNIAAFDFLNIQIDQNLDYLFFTKYASSEPTNTLGAEEKSPAPVGYWSFNEGYGTTAHDESQNGNDGTIFGATWKDESECVSGKCMYFRGTTDNRDYVTYGNIYNEDDIQQEMTVGVWFRTDTLSQNDGSGMLISKAQYSVDNQAWSMFVSSSGVSWNVYDDDASANIQTNDFNLNEWNYVVGTWDNGEQRFYLNGVLVDSDTRGFTKINDSNSVVYVGLADSTANHWFKGFVDEPKIYNYARTADQIKQDYNAGLAGLSAPKGVATAIGSKSPSWMSDGLVGHWKMDESSWDGTVGEVIDASGNENNGTSSGGATTAGGRFGSGGDFDGVDDYVDCGSDSSLDTAESITFSFWINREDDTIGDRGIVQYDGQTFEVRTWLENKLKIVLKTTDNPTLQAIYPTATYLSGWNHIVVTYVNTGILKIYINGQSVWEDSTTWSGNLAIGDQNFEIGKADNSLKLFKGLIDETRIYNRALSEQEIKDLYEYAPGPVLHLKMDEKSGTMAYDTSGNENNGTLTNMDSSSDWVSGKYGSALDFDGVDDSLNITHPTSGILDFGNNNFSISAWVKSTDAETDVGVLSKGLWGAGRDSGWGFIWQGSKISFETGFSKLISNKDVNDGSFHHIQGVREDGELRLYIDGILDNSSNPTLKSCTNTAYFNLAQRGVGVGYFDGAIDEVLVYDYAIDQKQIVEDMLVRQSFSGGGNAGQEGSQVAYWKFDEGYGTTAYDSVGDNNGTLLNSPTWTNEGKFGKTVEFDGVNDYVNCGKDSELDLTSNGTISVWVKSDLEYPNTTETTKFRGIVSKTIGGLSGQQSYYIDWYGTNTTRYLRAVIGDEITTQGFKITDFDFGSGWNHIVYSFDENYHYLYINGVAQSPIEKTITAQVLDVNVFIGGDFNTSVHSFDGLIDEVKIYNYALSEEDVQKDYNQGKSLFMGGMSTEADGITPSFSTSREYCVPGDTSTCNPPVAEWKFDEKIGTTAYDTSENGNNGTLTNSPTWTRGKKGSALDFDGVDDTVSIADDDSYDFDTDDNFTVSAWLKIPENQTNIDVGNNMIIEKWGLGGAYPFVLRVRNQTYGSQEITVARYDLTNNPAINSQNEYNDNLWHYVVFEKDGSLLSLYIDGVLDGTTTDTTTATTVNTSPLFLASRNGSYPFEGQIDDVKIYDYARTSAQIAWDYNRGKPIAHWKMDEGEGTTVHDESGNGNHGTMTNMSANDWVDGKINKGLDFDGVDDYVNCGNSSELSFGEGDFSISTWVKPDGPQDHIASIVDKYSGPGYFISLNGLTPKLFLSDASGGYLLSNCGTKTVEDGQWNHLTFSFDRSGLASCFINGVQTGTVDISIESGNLDTSRSLYIGRESVDNRWFNGSIDDVQIYSHTLTEKQVQNIYNGGAVSYR